MTKKYKIPLIIIGILLILSISLLVSKKFLAKDTVKEPSVKSNVVEAMEEYGYSLDDRDTKVYKEKYYELKEVLESEEIDYEEYSNLIVQMFLIDLLTIDNKINKYDVGGYEFLYESEQDKFKNKVIDSIYDIVEDNSYGTRKQNLPEVSSVEIIDSKEIKEEIEGIKKTGYEYNVTISYIKDMGYDSELVIKTIKDENKMYIIEYTTNN